MSERFDLWLKGLNPKTAKSYGHFLTRLFKLAGMTPDEALDRCKADIQAYFDLCDLAGSKFTAHGKHSAVYALRSFLHKSDRKLMLPKAEEPTPPATKPTVRLTWEQALSICAACRKPYNLVLKLMLHCGWGIGEFLKFNSAETWQTIQAYLQAKPDAEYFRFEFAGRKRNHKQFYSLIPTGLLKEIQANLEVPVKASYGFIFPDSEATTDWRERRKTRKYRTEGVPLDVEHYQSARTYLEVAFKTALKHAPIIVQGRPSVHELRDTFLTRASQVHCHDDAANFVVGHTIDPLGYRKAVYDEAWLWSELKKIYGPSAASATEVEQLRGKLFEYEKRMVDLEEKLEFSLRLVENTGTKGLLLAARAVVGSAQVKTLRDKMVAGNIKARKQRAERVISERRRRK